MKRKMTIQEIRAGIRNHILSEVGSWSTTGPDTTNVLSPEQIMTLRNAGFDVAGINPQNLTGEMQSALDWVAQGKNIADWIPEDAMDADQLAAIGADYDVDGNPLPADDGDADDDGIPDRLEEDLANLVANAGERLSVGEIAEFMLDALSDKMHGGFAQEEVVTAVESWVHTRSRDHQSMAESKSTNTRLHEMFRGRK